MDLQELLETFELVDQWDERYRILIDLGRSLPEFPAEARTEDNRVEGCTSNVWLIHETTDDEPPRHMFRADSDAFIVKGLIAIVLMAYSGRTQEEISTTNIREIFSQLGLEQNLSPNRRDGFYAMVGRIHELSGAQTQTA